MMMKMLSLPASMQQELAARALRACMAAEAAMASLRAECKPLQSASPQRVLALNTKNMGNAHRSLQLQIEACESFSLSATAAFKQLCDVIFCTDSERSMNFEHDSMLHENTHYSKSSKVQLSDLAASIDGELTDCGPWKSRTNAPDHSSARSKGNGESIPAHDTTTRDHSAGVQVTDAEDTLLWGPENGAAYTRFPSPETDITATSSREEIVERRLIEDTDWSRQLDSQHVKDREDSSQSGNDIVMSNIYEDSDVSDVDVDLRCDVSSLREISILPTNSSENQLDDGFKLHKPTKSQSIYSANTESSTCSAEHAGNSAQIHQPTTSDISELDSEHEHHATQSMEIHFNESTKNSRLAGVAEASFQQTMDLETPTYASDAHSGVSSHTATGSPPPVSSSSNEVPERCNSYGPYIELQPATPSFSTPIHASWTMAEVSCTQTPSSSASRFSWSRETTRPVDTPTTTQPLSILEYNPSKYASMERWDPSKESSDLPLYHAHPQLLKSIGTNPAPASSAERGLHQEFKPTALSFESQDLAVRKLRPLFNREIGHSPTSPPYADENHCVEPNVALTPSLYTLKMRSMFSRENLARKPSPGHSMPAQMQSSYDHSDGNLFSMATAVSLSSGYRQPSMSSGLPCGTSAYVSVMEKKQALQIVSETPLLTQFSVSPISSSSSTSSLSRESPASSNNSGSESSGREGSLDNYKKKLENLQEQFPRAHGSFRREPQSSWGTTRIGALETNPVGNSSVQNACKIPWQTSHMSTTTTEVERTYVCAASSSGSTSEAKHNSAQRLPTNGGVGYIQGNLSDRSVCCPGSKGSLESDSRYDRITQGYKISDSQVSEAGDVRSTSNRETSEVTSRELNRKDSAQKSHRRPEPTSWRWNDQSNKETGAPVPVSSSCRTSDSVAMVGGAAGDCVRGESTLMSLTPLSDSDNDDDDSSNTEREWNNILISMQQRGKPKHNELVLDSYSLTN